MPLNGSETPLANQTERDEPYKEGASTDLDVIQTLLEPALGDRSDPSRSDSREFRSTQHEI